MLESLFIRLRAFVVCTLNTRILLLLLMRLLRLLVDNVGREHCSSSHGKQIDSHLLCTVLELTLDRDQLFALLVLGDRLMSDKLDLSFSVAFVRV